MDREIAYSYNDEGYFIGECRCQPNPVRKGEYLLPRNATEKKPPAFDPETQRCRWNGGAWTIEDIPAPPEPVEPPEPEPAEPDRFDRLVAALVGAGILTEEKVREIVGAASAAASAEPSSLYGEAGAEVDET